MSTTQPQAPIPIRITCPVCGLLHVDKGEYATKPHHTHACQGCGHVWRPAVHCTVGVQFLPGFLDDPTFDPDLPTISRCLHGAEPRPSCSRICDACGCTCDVHRAIVEGGKACSGKNGSCNCPGWIELPVGPQRREGPLYQLRPIPAL